MTVYNYLRACWSDGDDPIDDAPPAVLTAIEAWLAVQRSSVPGDWIRWESFPAQRLTLVALHHCIEGAEDGTPRALTHAIAVPDRQLAEPTAAELQGLFAFIYGWPLDATLCDLQASLAAHPLAENLPRVLALFATEDHVARLSWTGFDSESGRTPEAGRVEPRSMPSRLSIGLASFAIGVLLAGSFALLGRSSGPEPPAPPKSPPVVGAEPRISELQKQVEALTAALRQREAAHHREIASLGEAKGELAAASVSAPPRTVSRVLPSPAPTSPPTSQGESGSRAPALPEVAAPPPIVRSRSMVGPRSYYVIETTARVRAGPSSREPTRKLLGLDALVEVKGRRGEWLEIEPPPGVEAPTWIHSSVVAAVEDE